MEHDYVTIQDVISSEMNTMSISSWIKPEFNSGTPQYTITSKENSFNLYVTNINQPPHTVGFSVFDGVQWNSISGHTTLDDRWHHIMASVNGSNISLYMDGNLEDEQTLQNEFSIGDNGKYGITDSQISVSDSEIVVGAYVSTLREEIKTSDKFVGKIATVDVFTDVLTAEQIYHKYETDLSQFYKYVSLYETVQIDDELLDDAIPVYEFAINEESYEIDLHENLVVNDLISIIGLDNTVYLEELLNIQETISVTTSAVNTFSVNLDEFISFNDKISTGQTSIQLEEILSFNDNVIGINPFVPSVNPEIQMVKTGFLITENPKFELEYYSEKDAVKIDQQQIVNATSIANQLQEDLASTPGELLTKLGINEITTAIQVIETRNTIYQLEDQVEQIPEDVNAEDIKELQEKVEEVTKSIDETAKKLEETHLVDKAPEIEKSAEIIREAADITQNVNQTGTWKTTGENITTRIIAPDGSIFADEAFFEKEREGKFDVEVLSEVVAKPGIYTVESTIIVDETEYTINEEFAWGLVSLNTKKSTYYPGDTAEFEIVVLDSVGSPVCDANLVMSINGTVLSSGAGITPNVECGIYDAGYETGIEGTYYVNISAIAEGIQTGFETTFDVASFVEFDILRTAQSKIDPVHNPNEFEVIIDVTSHTDATDIQIVESVPSVFDIVSDGIVTETTDGKTITWDKILQNQTAQIKYKYSVPMIFPELFPLGEAVISYDNKTFTEARPWFVANDPDFPDDWAKKLLLVDSSLVEGSSDIANFPVLVNMTDSNFPNNSNGAGIRFTSDGTTAVPFEIEKYDQDNRTLTAWVKLTVDHDDDTRFFIHYSQTEAIDSVADVWTNYVAVNHLKDETDTGNANKATREVEGSKGDNTDNWNSLSMNTANSGTGLITDDTKTGYALEFDGSNDRLCLDNATTSSDGRFDCDPGGTSSIFDGEQPNRTIEFWYWAENANADDNEDYLLDVGHQTHGQSIYIEQNKIYAGNWRDSNAHREWTEDDTTSQTWHHVAFVTDGASTTSAGSGKIILYHDGEKIQEITGNNIQVEDVGGQASALGGIQGRTRDADGNALRGSGHYFDGKIDEFRVAHSALSADYIKTSYNTQNVPENFVREGIFLSESISLTATSTQDKLVEGENVIIRESIGVTDSVTTLSNDDMGTLGFSKKVLTTNATMITGSGSSLTGLPVLVTLTDDSDLSTGNVGSNGEGIRFTSDGTTFLDFEIETYTADIDKGSLIAWVEIPTLSASADTRFYIHYGYDGSVYKMDRSSQVWDGQSTGGKTYVAVNHLKDETDNNTHGTKEMVGSLGDGTDSWNSKNMNGLNANHNSGQKTGKIGFGLEFDGTNDMLCLDDINSDGAFDCSGGGSESSHFDIEQPNRTVEFWYNATNNLPAADNVSKVMFDGGSQNDGQAIYIYNSEIYAGNWRDNDQHREYTKDDTTLATWHHVAFVTDGADIGGTGSGKIILYHDGVNVHEITGANIQVDNNSNPTALGAIAGKINNHFGTDLSHKTQDNGGGGSGNPYSHYFDGVLDEFRVTNSVSSADYIKNSYNTQNDPTNFVREGIHLSESISLTDSSSTIKSRIVPLSETISLTDSVSKDGIINLSETISLTDADVVTEKESEANAVSRDESISFTDSITKEINKQISESISFTDSLSEGSATVTSLSESISLTDSTSVGREASLSESISFADSILKEVDTNLTESISLTDEISKKEITINLDETVSLTDAIAGDKEIRVVALTESISLTDGISKKETTINLDETVSLTDAIAGDKEIRVVALTESISLTDVISKKETTINLDETVSLTDAISGDKETRVVALTESIELEDVISKKETSYQSR